MTMKIWNAETIVKARKAHKLTQRSLANRLGCRQQTVSEWETNIYTPRNAYQKLLSLLFVSEQKE